MRRARDLLRHLCSAGEQLGKYTTDVAVRTGDTIVYTRPKPPRPHRPWVDLEPIGPPRHPLARYQEHPLKKKIYDTAHKVTVSFIHLITLYFIFEIFRFGYYWKKWVDRTAEEMKREKRERLAREWADQRAAADREYSQYI